MDQTSSVTQEGSELHMNTNNDLVSQRSDVKGEIITGLDIGTTKVCVVIARPQAPNLLEIIGVAQSRSTGLRRCRH